jgi:N,N'-diacetyllegionaminate synthase
MPNIYTIAEIGQAHDGSLGMAHAYLDALATSGVDAVKFQVHIADAESSPAESFRVPFSSQDTTRMDYWRRVAFEPLQWAELKRHCETLHMDFLASPFSNAAVDLLESMHVRQFKVGSGEIDNMLLLERLSRTTARVILSSGMSTLAETDKAVSFFKEKGIPVSLMQCTSAYPTTPDQWGLQFIPFFKSRYEIPVGFSDHSGDIHASVAAAAFGAELLEFHVVFHGRMFGPDTSSSVLIDDVPRLIKGVHDTARSLHQPFDKCDVSDRENLRQIFGKTLALNKSLIQGQKIKFSDLEGKKPAGMGIPARDFKQIVGRTLRRKVDQWKFLSYEDLADPSSI